MFWWGVLMGGFLGCFLGCFLGILAISLCIMAKDNYEDHDDHGDKWIK